jgi:hypothetical protein
MPVMVWADVDVGISAFVAYLQTIPGVRTYASCQGTLGEGGPAPYAGYVMVSWRDDTARKAVETLGELKVLGKGHGQLVRRACVPEPAL